MMGTKMQYDQRYDIEQAWTAMLIFFDYLSRDIDKRFDNQGPNIGYLFSIFHMDPESFQIWKNVLKKEKFYISENVEKNLLQSEILDLIKAYLFYYQHILGLDISSLNKIVHELSREGAANNSDFIAWDEALSRSASGEEWKLKPLKEIQKLSGDFKIIFDEASLIPEKFFEFLRPGFSGVSEKVVNEFLSLWNSFSNLHDYEWRECYIKLFGKPWNGQKMSSDEIFCTMVAFNAMYSYRYSHDLYEIIKMLYGMQNRSQEYEYNWELWREICEKVSIWTRDSDEE